MNSITSLALNTYKDYSTGEIIAWQPGAKACYANGVMSEADAANESNACEFGIEASFDGGVTWQKDSFYTWTGGSDPKSGTSYRFPVIRASYVTRNVENPTIPTHVRIFINPQQPLSIAGTFTFE